MGTFDGVVGESVRLGSSLPTGGPTIKPCVELVATRYVLSKIRYPPATHGLSSLRLIARSRGDGMLQFPTVKIRMSKSSASVSIGNGSQRSWLQCLPAYSRSLLKIKVPVTVTLAETKLAIGDILDLVPGSILQFEKMCDETLVLEVGDHRIAEGETVKVGDKFGLRITSMVMPEERFHAVRSQQAGGADSDSRDT